GELAERLPDCECLVDLVEPFLAILRDWLGLRVLAGAGGEGVETPPAGAVRGTWVPRARAPPGGGGPVSPPGEGLEDVLGVLGAEAESAEADRAHVPGEAIDQGVPGLRVAGLAAADELCVAQGLELARRHGLPHRLEDPLGGLRGRLLAPACLRKT